MGLFDSTQEAASATAGKVVVSAAGSVYGLAHIQLSTVVSAATLVLTLFYMWGAFPRVWLTTVAWKRYLFNKDSTLLTSLAKRPMQSKED